MQVTDWSKVPIPGSYDDLYAHYGDPHSTDFASTYLVSNQHTIAGGKVISVTSHVAIADKLHAVFADLIAAGRIDLIQSYDGCYVLRQIRGVAKPSLHSWGLAIDVNAAEFPLGSLKQQDPVLIEAFSNHGFFWGGDFRLRKDPMHFQLTKPNTI